MDELEYRRLLKALPPSIEPARDLFPEIAARLGPQPVAARRRDVAWAYATAAGFALLALTVWWMPRAPISPAGERTVAAEAPPPTLREMRAMRAEYAAALVAGSGGRVSELREHADPRLVAAWTELDAAEAEIVAALELRPDARFLLNRLRLVEDQRLRIAQKALSV